MLVLHTSQLFMYGWLGNRKACASNLDGLQSFKELFLTLHHVAMTNIWVGATMGPVFSWSLLEGFISNLNKTYKETIQKEIEIDLFLYYTSLLKTKKLCLMLIRSQYSNPLLTISMLWKSSKYYKHNISLTFIA